MAGALLFALAAFVAITSVTSLLGYSEPKPTFLGIASAGLATDAIWHVKWADSVAALAVLPLIGWEGREAMRGRTCGCC